MVREKVGRGRMSSGKKEYSERGLKEEWRGRGEGWWEGRRTRRRKIDWPR